MIAGLILNRLRRFRGYIDGDGHVLWDEIAELPVSGGEEAMVAVARALERADECLDDTNRALILRAVMVMQYQGSVRAAMVATSFPDQEIR